MVHMLLLTIMEMVVSPLHAEPMVPLNQEQLYYSYAPLVEKASPAVVNIYTSRKVRVQSGISPLFNDPFFEQFFRSPLRHTPRQREVRSLGSGVIIAKSGVVITSLHIVRGAEDIRIVLKDNREFSAKIVMEDTPSDLALLEIEGEDADFQALPIVDSDHLNVGDLVLAIGNPFGIGQTVTSGIVSGLARSAAGINDFDFFIQTDAAINPGNSGGALVDMQGNLVGINTAIYSKSGGSNGIGFAIPSNMVRALLRHRKEDGSFARPWLGGEYQPMTPEMAESLGSPELQGVLIRDIYPNSPAEQAGLKAGDVMMQFDDKPIMTIPSLRFYIHTADKETPIPLRYRRDGKDRIAIVRLSDMPESLPSDQPVTLQGQHPLNGAVIAPVTSSNALRYGFSRSAEGVVVVQTPNTRSRAFMRIGDIITIANGKRIHTVAHLKEALRQNPRSLSLTLIRGGQQIELRMSQ